MCTEITFTEVFISTDQLKYWEDSKIEKYNPESSFTSHAVNEVLPSLQDQDVAERLV